MTDSNQTNKPIAETDDAGGTAKSRLSGPLMTVLKVVVSIGLLYALLSRVDVVDLWHYARGASPIWLLVAVALYTLSVAASAWRWGLLLNAQGIGMPFKALVSSFLVANFFNNFLPSNIGGDVIRVADTSKAAGSKTLATTVVIIDRGIGLIGLMLTAALGATVTRMTAGPVSPAMLWAGLALAIGVSVPAFVSPDSVGRLLKPLRVFHAEWVEERIGRLTAALGRFGDRPRALLGCFGGAIVVQVLLVLFYAAVARSLQIPISSFHLAVIVPMTFIVQMVPISMNGLGVREATFAFYFSRLGLPLESALLVSIIGAALTTLFSLSGGIVYLSRRR